MFKFIKQYLKRQDEIELAGLQEQLNMELEIGHKTGTVYPMALSDLARRIGELKEKLKNNYGVK